MERPRPKASPRLPPTVNEFEKSVTREWAKLNVAKKHLTMMKQIQIKIGSLA